MTAISLRTRALETFTRMQLNGGKNTLPRENRVFYAMTVECNSNSWGCCGPLVFADRISVTEVTPPQEKYEASKELYLESIVQACQVSPEVNAYVMRMINSPCGSFGWWDH